MWLIFILLLARADEPKNIPQAEIKAYLKSFARQSGGIIRMEDVKDSKYLFTKLAWEPGKGGVIGDCDAIIKTIPYTIHMDERHWKQAGPIEKWGLMFHELGHCACGLDHSYEAGTEWLVGLLERQHIKVWHAQKLADGCPNSLMNYLLPSKACLAVHGPEYAADLFKKCKRPNRLVPLRQYNMSLPE